MSLLSHLDGQRRHVLGILEGLSDEDLHRPVLPSGWSCLGLVNHLALDVERFWFRAVVAGERVALASHAWTVAADIPAADLLDLYRHEIDVANAVIGSTPLDASPAWWPKDQFGDWRLDSVEEVLLHVITETACHAGHLDSVRELIDGKQWMVLA
jgi:uncharacterized damage-inducible protein DinB